MIRGALANSKAHKPAESQRHSPASLIPLHRKNRTEDEKSLTGWIPAAWQRKTGRAATLLESFYHAFHGVYAALKEQRNVRIHFCAAAVAIGLGLYVRLDVVSWLALALAIGLVITMEFLNTALEHLVDLASRGQYHRSARYAKDTAAGAVLIASIVAVAIGAVIFLPRLFGLH
jgi:diacylglycerol kinase